MTKETPKELDVIADAVVGAADTVRATVEQRWINRLKRTLKDVPLKILKLFRCPSYTLMASVFSP